MNIDRFLGFAICLALLLPVNSAAAEPYKTWAQLMPWQIEALQPVAAEWDSLPTKLRKNLLVAANHYRQLTPEQKKLFQSRLETWSKLTPEQRERAREKFLAFSKIKPNLRVQVRKMVHEQTSNSASSAVPVTAEMQ